MPVCAHVVGFHGDDTPVKARSNKLGTSLCNSRRTFQNGHLMWGCWWQDERMWRCLSSLTTLRELDTEDLTLADIPGEVSLLTLLTRLRHCRGLKDLSLDLIPLWNLVGLQIMEGVEREVCVPVMLSTCQSLETLSLDCCGNLKLTREEMQVLEMLPRLKKIFFSKIYAWEGPCAQELVRLARELPLVKIYF